MPETPQVKTQVEQIRRAIESDGECFVSCEELRVLCGDVAYSNRFDHVSDIAQYEGWRFDFLKDGSVRFTKPFSPNPQPIRPDS